jgi:hypothetical protein
VAGGPKTAPIIARVPVSHKVISSTAGYPVTPRTAFSLPSQDRLRAVSGTLMDEHPSKATVHDYVFDYLAPGQTESRADAGQLVDAVGRVEASSTCGTGQSPI